MFVGCTRKHIVVTRLPFNTMRDIDERCPKCLASRFGTSSAQHAQALAAERTAERLAADDLFSDQDALGRRGSLSALADIIVGMNFHLPTSGAISYLFTPNEPPAPTRQGIVLTYLAQAINNYGGRLCRDEEDGVSQPSVVVAVSLAFVDDKPAFFFGVNANDRHIWAIDQYTRAIPRQIAGVVCHTVLEREPHGGTKIEQRLQDAGDVSAWSWHAEQKVLKSIKDHGERARRTATCIGISHRLGPCTEATAGKGANFCRLYLNTKADKDAGRAIGQRSVAAYWYSAPVAQVQKVSLRYILNAEQNNLLTTFGDNALPLLFHQVGN